MPPRHSGEKFMPELSGDRESENFAKLVKNY